MTEDETVRWHHLLNRREFEQTLEDSEKIGKPGVLQSIGLQRVRHDLVTEQQPQWCWELVNMKYLVVLFLLLYCRHV